MANIVYIATSIDGYIADKNGKIDWLLKIPNPSDSDYGFSDFMKRVDAIVMGRNTFQTVMNFKDWPYPKKVFVLSKTLKTIPHEFNDKAEIISSHPHEIVSELAKRGFHHLYIDGGKTIQSFLKCDLIDELIITRIPVILGYGTPLFAKQEIELEFKHEQTEIYENGLIKSTYKRVYLS